jgi:hypothetical protein
LNENGIKAVAFTTASKEDKKIWSQVDDGEFRIVYITPAALMASESYFRFFRGSPAAFVDNLCAVAIDECTLIWDWEGFRERCIFAEQFYHKLCRWERIPFVCLSSSFAPLVDGDSSKKRRPMIKTASPSRDDVNIAVSGIKQPGITHLLELIPKQIHDPREIPKTTIFHDQIDNGIHIANRLRAQLPDEIVGSPPRSIIACLFDTMDLETRSIVLSNFRDGTARILVCMHAWSLDLDVPDVEKVIQWKVSEHLDFSDLHQRIGKVGMENSNQGIFHLYVQKNLLKSMSRDYSQEIRNWQEAWHNSDLFYDDYELSDTENESEFEYDEYERRVRKWKKRPLGRFGLPVRPDTRDNVVRHLYREARIIRKALRAVQQERRRTGRDTLSSTIKLDPAVLWFLCTRGSRHRLFRVIFKSQIHVKIQISPTIVQVDNMFSIHK